MEDSITPGEIARGDARVLEKIYQSYQQGFLAWSRQKFNLDRDESREIFQDSVVTLYENIINGKLVDMKSSIKTYLFAIGKNKAMEFLRRSNRHEALEALSYEPQETIHLEMEAESESMRRLRLMKECVRELGQACQDILTLYYFQQLSLAQICEKLSYKNEETVKSQKFKCMQQLRANFSTKYGGRL